MDLKKDLEAPQQSKAAELVGIPAVLLYRGPRDGNRKVPTQFGRRDAFAAHAFTIEGEQGQVLFFWTNVVNALAAWLTKPDDAVVVTFAKEGKAYNVIEVKDASAVSALVEIAEPFLAGINAGTDDDYPYSDNDAPL